MINNKNFLKVLSTIFAFALILFTISCSRDVDELEEADFPAIGEVFIDGFSPGLEYAAFGGSVVTAFDVDSDITYKGSASMKFAVPDVGDPAGSYAGGAYFTGSGRNLSGFDALTFWMKSTQPASVDVLGFGNDLGENKYVVTLTDVAVNSNWKKYIIPIPDPSKLAEEKGMFFYSEGPENGKGYTFWIDEVKFEKLGTVALLQAGIENGEDKVVSAETGDEVTVGGLISTFNLPNGVNQIVSIAPSYMEFTSSDNSIASVSPLGVASVIDSGLTVITAKLKEFTAEGSLTIEATGEAVRPLFPAPVPTVSPDSVISMFSNAYNNVPIDTWNTGWEFSTAVLDDIQIDGDDVKRYKNLNFVGIEFVGQTIDASEMTHFHMDLWTPDPTDIPAAFKILLVDFGADNSFEGGDDSSHEITITSPTLQTEAWVSIDIPMSNFTGLTSRSNLAQLVLSGDLPNVFIDNVYFYIGDGGGEAIPPTSGPAAPTQDAGDVISIYSDEYNDVPRDGFNFYGNAAFEEVDLMGNNALKYTFVGGDGGNFQVIELGGANQIDAAAAGMTNFRFDLWFPNVIDGSSTYLMKLVDFGATSSEAVITVDASSNPAISQGMWLQFDLTLAELQGLGLMGSSNIQQLVIDLMNIGEVYIDNIYFYKEGGGGGDEPTAAAPNPTQDAGNVISLFSNAYDDVPVDTWRTDWSSATLEDVQVDGNDTKKYSDLDFVGIETVSNQIDASNMTHLHLDLWSADYTFFGIKLVDFGPDGAFGGGDDAEHQINIEMPNQKQWVSLDLPLADFGGLTTRANIAQYIFVGQPTGTTTIYVDNFYFYGDGGGGDEPTMAAPTPMEDPANVISLFSNAYDDRPVDTWRTDWSSATLEDVMIEGNDTKKYSDLDFVGIETVSNQIDASSMTHLHLDLWSADYTFFGIKLVDFGADGGFGGGDDVEHQINIEMPNQKEWVSLDLALSDFVGLTTRANVAQYIIVGQPTGTTTVYVDNFYFYGDGSGGDEPTMAAPTPSQVPGNVISLFSNAYDDRPVDTWRTDWSSATLEDVMIEGNDTKKYSDLDFVGIETVSNQIDASAMTHLHLDLWSADYTFFGIKLVDFGADGGFGGGDDVEHQINIEMPNQKEWVSLDLALSDFAGLTTRANIAQYIIVGQPTGTTTLYVDNFFFYKEGGGGDPYDLSQTIDFEPSGYGASWTWNVFENDTDPPLEFVANPDATGANTSSTVAKITALQTGNPWAGTETAHGELGLTFDLDNSNKIIKIMVYKTVISDVGIKLVTPSGGAQAEIKVSNTVTNQWEEITFDFSGYIGLGDTTGLDQIVVFPDFDLSGRTSDNVVYFDNITFNP